MDEKKQEWIELRRSIITQNYNLPEQEQAKVDDLFKRMEALADQCDDQGEFEKRFAQDPMNAEFNQMLTNYAAYNTATQAAMANMVNTNTVGDMMKDELKSKAKRTARSAIVNSVPSEVSDVMTYGTNMIPGVSEVRTAKSLWWQIKRLFGIGK